MQDGTPEETRLRMMLSQRQRQIEALRVALANLVAVHDIKADDDDGEAWGPALAAAREALAE